MQRLPESREICTHRWLNQLKILITSYPTRYATLKEDTAWEYFVKNTHFVAASTNVGKTQPDGTQRIH